MAYLEQRDIGSERRQRARPAPLFNVPTDITQHGESATLLEFPGAHRPGRCVEINRVRHLLRPQDVADAEQRAHELNIGADRVLVAAGAISEDAYLLALASELGVAFEPLDGVAREACPLPEESLTTAVTAGILPLHVDAGVVFVVAPRELAARRLCVFFAHRPDERERFRLTSTPRLHRYVARHGRAAIGHLATHSLASVRPDLSAAPRRTHLPALTAAAGTPLGGTWLAWPLAAEIVAGLLLAPIYLGWSVLRVICALTAPKTPARDVALPDGELPVYSIIVALHRESATVADLFAALRALDYPREKLDVKLALERDDVATRAAVAALDPEPWIEVVLVPEIGPRTKPKALNAALAFARGTFCAIFDAEDRPEPDQLRRALQVFMSAGGGVGCVQARLTIDNTGDNWLTGYYTAEYAGLFDVMLPALAQMRAPVPLGGSSNHFRTQVLRKIGAWDPYNVTEDADLGMRLHRLGYRTIIIASSTFEEAPARLRAWMCQRTRWFKGWMQTWLVHMRAPRQLLRDLGPGGFAIFQLAVVATVMSALVHLLFIAAIAWSILVDRTPLFGPDAPAPILVGFFTLTLLAGYVTSALVALQGLARRGLLASAWVVMLVPLHWIMLSTAAWRAVYQLLRDPYRWEKTEHGLARTSRRSR
ncbi:MAG: glycosyltransferase [Proteobacteria bacterium]|nr:glycosyltransferase [Pseudomonadota bacterium]